MTQAPWNQTSQPSQPTQNRLCSSAVDTPQMHSCAAAASAACAPTSAGCLFGAMVVVLAPWVEEEEDDDASVLPLLLG